MRHLKSFRLYESQAQAQIETAEDVVEMTKQLEEDLKAKARGEGVEYGEVCLDELKGIWPSLSKELKKVIKDKMGEAFKETGLTESRRFGSRTYGNRYDESFIDVEELTPAEVAQAKSMSSKIASALGVAGLILSVVGGNLLGFGLTGNIKSTGDSGEVISNWNSEGQTLLGENGHLAPILVAAGIGCLVAGVLSIYGSTKSDKIASGFQKLGKRFGSR